MTKSTRWLRLVFVWAAIAMAASAASGVAFITPTAYDGLDVAGYQNVGGKPIYSAIRSQREWSEWVGRLRSNRVAPLGSTSVPPAAVDFTRYTALVIALGTRPTGGYGILVTRIWDDGAVIHAPVLEVQPTGPDCLAATVLTSPMVVELIPKTLKPVIFEMQVAALDCRSPPRSIRASTPGDMERMHE